MLSLIIGYIKRISVCMLTNRRKLAHFKSKLAKIQQKLTICMIFILNSLTAYIQIRGPDKDILFA